MTHGRDQGLDTHQGILDEASAGHAATGRHAALHARAQAAVHRAEEAVRRAEAARRRADRVAKRAQADY